MAESCAGDETPNEVTACPKPRRRRKLLWVGGGLISTLLIAFLGFHLYLQVAEWLDPSGRVYVEVDGERIALEQHTEIVTPSSHEAADTVTATAEVAPAVAGDSARSPSPRSAASATAKPPPVLPPLQLQIPAIELDVPVVLADNQNLPRVPLAGWLFKSAFPATAGNTVLLGHVNGKAAIFQRLAELAPGDEIRVVTAEQVHIYRVRTQEIVPADATQVLLPTTESTITLITCTGDWLPQARTFTHRLVVRGYYTAAEEPSGSDP